LIYFIKINFVLKLGFGHSGSGRFTATGRNDKCTTVIRFDVDRSDLVPQFRRDHPEELVPVLRQRVRGFHGNLPADTSVPVPETPGGAGESQIDLNVN
jgi:hypothetical protein